MIRRLVVVTLLLAGNIWSNSESDPGALYNTEGRLISYWPD